MIARKKYHGLRAYQIRPSVRATHLKMASVTTSEFVRTSSPADALPFSLIEQKGLLTRLAEELARALSELARNPRGFIRDLFTDDTKDAKRSRRIQIGLACAVLAHIAILALIAFLGLRGLNKSAEEADEHKAERLTVTMLNNKAEDIKAERPRGDNGSGGGSGGSHSLLPASKGALPKIAPTPQIIKPLAPTAMRPSLPVSPTLLGPESAPPPVGVAIGIPTGVSSEAPAPGPGEGDGIGGGKGSGAGTGNGPGTGPGNDGGKGNKPGNYGSPEGTNATPSVVDWRRPPQSGYTPFIWIYKARPTITPEAQEYKVVGTVLLRATFHADGRITDIEIVNRVPYMTESAIEALSRSKFTPAKVNGVAITLTKVLVKIEVHY